MLIYFSHDKEISYWDGGTPEIKAWQQSHRCNVICRLLGLKNSSIDDRVVVKMGTYIRTLLTWLSVSLAGL
jgi:hypothetical protein